MLQELVRITSNLYEVRYPEAKAIFLAGSVLRGEGTSTSDLDIVVIFDHLPCAYRDSYLYESWPVEAFVHDPQTLEYFFRHVDCPIGVPSLPTMVKEGIEVPAANEFTHSLKRLADSVLNDGPPKWDDADIDRSRYDITDLVDDLRDPRSVAEVYATATLLYSAIANHYLRNKNLWSAKGKTIPRRLRAVDPEFAEKFVDSFDDVFSNGCSGKAIELASEVVAADGGFLFEGYRLSAPESWRITAQ